MMTSLGVIVWETGQRRSGGRRLNLDRDRHARALSDEQKDRVIRRHVRRLGKLGVRVHSLSAGAGSQNALSAS